MIKKNCCSKIFAADGNPLQPTGGVNTKPWKEWVSDFEPSSDPHLPMKCQSEGGELALFLCIRNSVAHDIGVLSTSCHPCFMCVVCCFDSRRLSNLHSSLSLQSFTPFLNFHLRFQCGSVRREVPCALPRMRSLTFWSTTPLSHSEGECLAGEGWDIKSDVRSDAWVGCPAFFLVARV